MNTVASSILTSPAHRLWLIAISSNTDSSNKMWRLLIILSACMAEPPAQPAVAIVTVNTPMTGIYRQTAESWGPLGFQFFEGDQGLSECGTDWWKTHLIDCQITIYVERPEHMIARYGSDSASEFETSTILIDKTVIDPFLLT